MMTTAERSRADRDQAAVCEPLIYQSLARFRFALRQFLAFSEATTRTAGVTPQQYQALLVVQTQGGDGIMIRDLAAQMLLQHHGCVQLVDRLVTAGYVERHRSDTDRRRAMVVMTAAGCRLLNRLARAHMKELLKQEPLLADSLRQLRGINGLRLGK